MSPLLLTIPLVAAAPVPKDFKKETPKLDGAWECTSVESGGRVIPRQNMTWRFADDAVTITYGGGDAGVQPMPISTDPKASPMAFSFTEGARQLGIYEIKGDTLVICLGSSGQRPTDIAGGPNVAKYTLTRVKDK